MKTLAYVIYVIALVAFFLTAVCVANGNLAALVPLGIELVLIIALVRVLERYERG